MGKLNAIMTDGCYVHVEVPLTHTMGGGANINADDYVSYVERQEKTDEEKAIARENIGITDVDFVLKDGKKATVTVGGITSGTSISAGTTFDDFVDMLVNPYQKPTVSLSGVFYDINNNNVGTQAEVNTNVQKVVLTAVVGKKSKPVSSVRFLLGNDVLQEVSENVANGGTFTYTYTINSGTISSNAKFTAVAIDSDNKQATSAQVNITYVNYVYVKPKTSRTMSAPATSADIHAIGTPKAYSGSVSVGQTDVQYGVWVCCPSGYRPAIVTSNNESLPFTATSVEYTCNNGVKINYKVWYCESAAYNTAYYNKITFTTE